MTNDQAETEMRRLGRELFAENDEPDEDDPSDTGPGDRVALEGRNPGTVPDDGTREFVRALFDN